MLGNTRAAIARQPPGAGARSRQLDAANNLAWLLATRAEASAEERREAVPLAERASAARGGADPSLLDTLAVAYAAAGRFDEAVATAARAAALADAAGQPQTAREMRERGALYRSRRPFVEPSARAGVSP